MKYAYLKISQGRSVVSKAILFVTVWAAGSTAIAFGDETIDGIFGGVSTTINMPAPTGANQYHYKITAFDNGPTTVTVYLGQIFGLGGYTNTVTYTNKNVTGSAISDCIDDIGNIGYGLGSSKDLNNMTTPSYSALRDGVAAAIDDLKLQFAKNNNYKPGQILESYSVSVNDVQATANRGEKCFSLAGSAINWFVPYYGQQ